MDKIANCLEIFANVAAIATAVVAAVGFIWYVVERNTKRWKLERYLKSERVTDVDTGLRTILHLTARLGLTEDEILQASLRSSCIERKIAADPDTGRAKAILFQYIDK